MTESTTSETSAGTSETSPETSAELSKALRTQQAQANRQVARLRAAVRERDSRLHEVEERLAALEGSTTYRFGRIVVGAARRPGRRATRLPRELYRLWKHRDSPQQPGQGRDITRVQSDVFDRQEDRLLAASPSALEGSVRQLVIAGVFGPSTPADLAGFARTVPLFPHDGALVLESADADLLLVDAAAGAAGGPWAYLGEPGMYDRERTLRTLLDAAGGRELPVVLWPAGRGDEGELAGVATAPGLSRLDWDAIAVPGVSLRRFNPAWGTARDRTPLVVDPGVRLPLGVRRAVDAITAAIGARVAAPGPAELPELLRRHAVTVAATPAQVPEQLASGAFVLCPAAVADALPADLRAHVHVVTDPAALHEVLSAVPRHDPRLALRTLFLRHSAPVRLAELCRRLEIDADPAAARGVTVVADVHAAADAARLADTVLAQAHRPVEVVVRHGVELPAGAFATVTARLAEHGVTVHLQAADGRAATPGDAAWVAPWQTRAHVPDSYLADLVCAAECSGADAVGPAGFPDYTFVTAVEPALVRRELYETGGAPDGWAARGVRLMSLDPRS
ncbi:hypothetical protein [Actinomadura sp. HBU206391]|uniref:hypothetical protein n=1 Tax=Actinomadura sp. HBU206391 TaxID=2731692 RepID=UPI0016506F42|nr:hypothetical protein [Actinomadura sp. HBU206391]MBC6458742.1 hypothetical protein [Actinomadura sp. HBU206391]